jgi:RimJ/RimL family protein N-acetyltransferase
VIVDGELLGHVMLLPMDDGRGELANFLHQSIRNRGIGTFINRIALQVAREHGTGRVWLCVEPFNRAAVRSYEKAGFRRLPGTLWRARDRDG